MTDIQILTLTESDLGKVQMFCGHSPTYRRGYDAKMEWMRAPPAGGDALHAAAGARV